MTAPTFLRVVILSMAMVALPGCTNKKDQAKIKQLQADIESIQEENNAAISEREKELQQRDETARTAQTESTQQIQQLTQERDAAILELTALKKTSARAEAALAASVPKDASTPGHPDYNPANEAKITQAVATITGDVASGNGFVVAIGDKRYLYTAGHILSGNSRLSIANSAGTKFVKFGNLETAEGAGCVRLELLDAAGAPALELEDETVQVKAGTAVAALGASNAAGSITAERGTASAQTADAINVDTNLLSERIGGPLIVSATGKVIAVILNPGAERTELWAPSANAAAAAPAAVEVPCRACRLNRKLVWKPVPVATFLADAKRINDYDAITRVAQALAVLSPSPNGLGIQATVPNGDTALTVLTDAKDLPIAAEIIAMHTQLMGKRNVRSSDADLKKRFASLISSALSQMQRSSVGFEPAKFNSYHRRFAENSVKWRKEAIQKLQGMGG